MIILEKTIQPTKTSTNIVLGSICTFVSIEMISNLIITSDYWLCQLSVLTTDCTKEPCFSFALDLQKPYCKRQWLFVLSSHLCGCRLYNLVHRYTVEDRNVGLCVKLPSGLLWLEKRKRKRKKNNVQWCHFWKQIRTPKRCSCISLVTVSRSV